MEKKDVLIVLLVIALIAVIIYYLIRKNSAQTSTVVTTTTGTVQPTNQPSFQVVTYQVTPPTNLKIPLLSEDFVVSIKPLTNQPVSYQAWFNIENDSNLHEDSLIINENPVTITQETPIIYSDTLSSQGIPYRGYPYLVLAMAGGQAEVKVSFYVP